jgi:hypothetical protein
VLALLASTRSMRDSGSGPAGAQHPGSAVPRPAGDGSSRVRPSPVVAAGVVLIAVQLGWKAYLLSHFYFRQDDFQLMDHALSSGFNDRYLFTIGPEQLAPAGRALAWLLVRVSVYNWTLASACTIILLAAVSLAMLRLLLLLHGRRQAILIPLVIFLFTPLTLPGLSFWTTTLLWLPLQLTMVLAVSSHIRYLRSGSAAHAIAAAAWLVTGLLFDELGVLVPVLLFALTSAFFTPGRPGRWWQTASLVARRYWRAWAMYGIVAVAYLVVYVVQLPTSVQQPTSPPSIASVLTLASTMLRVSFVPAALGGPWHWSAQGGYGYAAETPGLTQVCWVVALLVVAASLRYRRHALRAWVILAGWLLLADLLPVVLSRLTELPATRLGADLHYVADSAPVLALCVGLAFWPVVGEEQPYRVARPTSLPLAISSLTLVGAVAAGSFWSGTTYLSQTSSSVTRSYIAHARQALARAPTGTVIVTGLTPATVMFARFLGTAAQTSRVLGPLAPKASRIRFTTAPAGVIGDLMIFTNRGTLRPALDIGATSVSPAGNTGCWPVLTQPTTIPLRTSLFAYGWIVRLQYSGPATAMQVRFGAAVGAVTLQAGTHDVYIPVVGAGNAVVVRRLDPGPPACIAHVTVGLMYVTKPTAQPAR